MSNSPREHDSEPSREQASDEGPIPLARPAPEFASPATPPRSEHQTPTHQARSSAPLDVEDLRCPNCAAFLKSGAVLCLKCGYDLQANLIRQPSVGVDVITDLDELDQGSPPRESKRSAQQPERDEFIPASRLGFSTLLIFGAVLGASALIAAGLRAGWIGGSFAYVIAYLLLTAYQLIVFTATGIGAILIAALGARQRFVRFEIVAARMLIAVASFLLLIHLKIPGVYDWLSKGLLVAAATGIYVLLLMGFFKKRREQAAWILLIHAGLCVALTLGMTLARWVSETGSSIQNTNDQP